jgi:hypothetical protein
MGFGGSTFMPELYKAAVMAVKFYGARNVWRQSVVREAYFKFIQTLGLEIT